MSNLLTYLEFRNKQRAIEELDDSMGFSITLGSEIKNNTAKIKLKNDLVSLFPDKTDKYRWVKNVSESKFSIINAKSDEAIPEEPIDIYAIYSDDNSVEERNAAENLLFSSIITKANIKYSETESSIELSCKDRSQVILDRLTSKGNFKKADSWTAPLVVQNLIRSGTDGGSSKPGFDADGNRVSYSKFLVDARTFSEGVVDSGTATSTSTNRLIETGQNFLTTVSVGDWVRNVDTHQYAYVLEVIDNENIRLTKNIITSGNDYEISNGFIQDTRPDATDFPNISFSQIKKPIADSISKVSQVEYTNTEPELSSGSVVKRTMRYFIDRDNRFHWYLPDDTPEHIMKVGVTDAISPDEKGYVIQNIDLTNSVDDTINFIKYKCGEDMENEQITGFSYASFSGSPERKDSLRVWEDIAVGMKQSEAIEGNIVLQTGVIYAYPTTYDPLPNGEDYPSFDSTQDTVPTSDSEYNTIFKREAKIKANSRSGDIFRKAANPKWKGTIQVRGYRFTVGDLIQLTSQPHGIKDIKVRINTIAHQFVAGGWTTQLTVEEDEPVVNKKTS